MLQGLMALEQQKHVEEKRILKDELTQSLSAKVLAAADEKTANLDAELHALQARMILVTPELQSRYAAGVAAANAAI